MIFTSPESMMETNVPNVSNTPSTMFVHWWNSFVMVTILLFLAHGIPTVSAEYHFGRRQLSSDSNCTGILCGNRQLPVSTNPVNSEHRVKILVFSVWVGDNPLNVSLLNHQLYCDRNGYEYKHFYMTREEFSEKYTGRPGAWLSVFAARDLLATSKADYFFKLDIDCVFARSDIRLEALLDPQQRYSFYTTHISQDSIFMQSQSWILKNSDYSRTLIKEWIEYVGWGNCGDLAYEQGAMHLMIGMAYSWHLGDKGTKYTCPNACTSLRSTYLHHHCVLDWLTDNGFGTAAAMSTHPHIFVYGFPNTSNAYSSPDDGFIYQWEQRSPLSSQFSPLTVHPLKRHLYDTPEKVAHYMHTMT